MLARVNPQENDAWDLHPLTKDKLAEILVFGQQQLPFVLRSGDDFNVGGTCVDVRSVDYVMACIAQMRGQCSVYALVDKPAHLGPVNRR
jgi:hypothetical protein